MPGLRPDFDPHGLLEYSVVFTDRALNHMSAKFQETMRDISSMLCEVYGATAVAIVPGGGTYAMESVARQIAAGAPLQVAEGADFRIFRIGLFGLDKPMDADGTIARLKAAVDTVF